MIKETYNVVDEFGLDLSTSGTMLRDTNYDWKVRYKDMLARERTLGRPDDMTSAQSEGWAAWQQLIWGTNIFGPTTPNGQPFISSSKAELYLGQGELVTRHSLDLAYGSYRFHGNHPHYYHPNRAKDNSTGSTQITMDLAGWIDDPRLKMVVADLSTSQLQMRPAFKSVAALNDTIGAGYHEHVKLGPVFIDGGGDGIWKSGRLTIGALLWDLGSGSAIAKEDGGIRFHNIDVGAMVVRGTPANLGQFHGFHCAVATVFVAGAAQNTITIDHIESDSAPNSIMARAAFFREGFGKILVKSLKLEDGINDEQKGPWRGGGGIDVKGQGNLNIGMISFSNGFVRPDSLFVIDPRLENGTMQNCLITAQGTGFNHQNLLHDCGNKVVISGPPNDAAWKLEYESRNGGIVTTKGYDHVRKTTNATKRLGYARHNGVGWSPALDHATATPAYPWDRKDTEVAPPQPVACTVWEVGAWGPCTNGVQTRTVTAGPSGCTGTPPGTKPATTQTCVTPVPGAPQVINNVTSATKQACTLPQVKRIRITGMKVTEALTAFAGYLIDNYLYAGFGQLYYTDPGNTPPATLVRAIVTNTSYAVDITFKTPVVMKWAVGTDHSDTCAWTATKLELFPS